MSSLPPPCAQDQSTPLWHKDDSELEANENQQMQKDAFPEPPSSARKQKRLKREGCQDSPLPEFYD